MLGAILLLAAGPQDSICTRMFGCHKSHDKERITCPVCSKSKMAKNDAACSFCAIKARICKHCGKPRRLAPKKRPQNRKTGAPLPVMRVLLLSTTKQTVECKGPVEITVPGAAKPIRSISKLPAMEITMTEAGFMIGDLRINNDWLTLVCLNKEAPIKLGKRQYAGLLHFVKKGKTFQIVSEVDLEQYLLGVVGPEIGYESPFESMKAQAICARSYAWSGLDKKKYTARNRPVWNVHDDTRSQVYIGVPTRNYKKVRQAVDETRGMFLEVNGRALRSEFSSACGGSTRRMGRQPGVKCGFCRRKKYGHGRGLCQWGAMNMAKEDWTYDKILAHYYSEAKLTDRY